jgi:hypothetical protein
MEKHAMARCVSHGPRAVTGKTSPNQCRKSQIVSQGGEDKRFAGHFPTKNYKF